MNKEQGERHKGIIQIIALILIILTFITNDSNVYIECWGMAQHLPLL